MGIETKAELGGSEMSFTAALIAIEELAKVDPSVSALVDIHVGFVSFLFYNKFFQMYMAVIDNFFLPIRTHLAVLACIDTVMKIYTSAT
jgi:hypothetical protein